MTASHTTYESSVKAAGPTKLATVATAIMTALTAIDSVNTVVGYNLQTGKNALLVSTTVTANLALAESRNNAEKAAQATAALARHTLQVAAVADGGQY
jgi:hypothetical protein